MDIVIGDKLTEESVSQMEQVFKEFKKQGGWKDYNDMKFSINGEEYWIYRCCNQPNTRFGFISNKEEYEWWNGDGTLYSGAMWERFERPRGFLYFELRQTTNNKTSFDDKMKMITHLATTYIKKFIQMREIRKESA